MKKTSVELTSGSIPLLLFRFMLPIFIGQFFQNLYNSVDSIVVGRYVGKTALAAVTSCGDIAHLLTGFFAGLSVGASIAFARYYGAADHGKLQKAIHTSVLFSVLFGVTMAAAGALAAPWLLELVKCPADVYGEAMAYLQVYFIGVLFTSIYNVATGVLRAVGDSKSPLKYLIVASVTNIALDVLFVKVFGTGVVGVAVATILSQATSVLLIFCRMLRTDDVYKLQLKELKIDPQILLEVLRLGLPAAVQNCMIAFSNLFVQRYVNTFGSSVMAGVGAGKKIDRYIGDIAKSLGMATAIFAGQNIGAKKYDRVFSAVRCAVGIGCAGLIVLGGVVWINAESIISIFTNDAETIFYGASMMRVIIPLYFTLLLQHIFANVLRSFGYSFVSMLAQLSGMIVCRQVYLFVAMRLDYNVSHIYYSFPVGWGFAALACIAAYLILVRRKKWGAEEEALAGSADDPLVV